MAAPIALNPSRTLTRSEAQPVREHPKQPKREKSLGQYAAGGEKGRWEYNWMT